LLVMLVAKLSYQPRPGTESVIRMAPLDMFIVCY
jgi:hypothetical protein